MTHAQAKEQYKDVKVSKEQMQGKWKQDASAYFDIPQGARMVSIKDITPIRKREHGVEQGRKYMALAMEGKMGKREPLSVERQTDGSYKLLDGNSTYHILNDEVGLKKVPVVEH